MSRRSAAAPLALIALLGVSAGLAFHRVLGTAPLVPVVAAAAVGPVALTALWSAGPRRRPLAGALLGSGLCWLALVSTTVLRGSLPTGVFGAIGNGLTDSWWRMLTVVLPAPDDPRTLVAIHALVWFATTAAAELLVRRGASLTAAVPPILVLLCGLLFSAGTPGSDTVSAAVSVLCVGLLIVLRSDQGVRTAVTGAAVVVAVSAAALAVGPELPHSDNPFDLRAYITPGSSALQATSPLDQIAGWLATPDTVLFRAALPPGDQPSLWRLAALDSFDGADWSPTGRLEPTGGRVPPPAAGPTPGGRVTQTVTVQALDSAWIPTQGVPVEISGVAVDADLTDATLVAQNGLRPGQSYTVRSQPPETAALTDPRGARPADDPADLELPGGMPAVLQQTAQQATAGATFPAQQAVLLADYLRATEAYDPKSPPGHTYGHLAYFLGTSHRGTSEQFACAYALMARDLGLPSRVVVGFSGGHRDADGTWEVRAGDVLAWPEVQFAGLGWVPFYPTPSPGSSVAEASGAGDQQLAAGESAARAAQDQAIGAAVPVPAATAGGASRAAAAKQSDGGISIWLLLAVVLVVVMMGSAGYALAFPAWRRGRRRRAEGPGERVIGAWLESLNDLRVLRFSPAVGANAPDIAAAACYLAANSGLDLASPISSLAKLADRAAFAADGAAPQHADDAWRYQDELRNALRSATGPWSRLVARIRWR